MTLPSTMLREFEETFSLTDAPPFPGLPDPELRALRIRLLSEEFKEYLDAEKTDNLTEVADALADMTYIIYGTAYHYGIPLDRVLAEVHRSNMAKAPDGIVTRRSDGKVLKPEGWTPPDVRKVLADHHWANVAYTVCGCFTCMGMGLKQPAIYDGTIITATKDGRFVNKFQGEGSRREERTEELCEKYRKGVFETVV